MYLKSIEIQGFKSFPDKVKLQFDRGMTAVVGPNGSGKSNLSDAVRWVLGEQSTKTLRGAKMEDVIFSGTKSRRPTGFAQVSLTMDNSDRVLPVEGDSVTITRKLYRSGESGYLINGSPVRLKDVRELFMDTGLGRDGYSVIGQGKIAEIVSAKEEDRREIFEEAAGISKFRYRKEEALRRLAAAQENLNRLMDILGELEDRVGPLKEQSEKAERFLKLSERKKSLELSLWLTRLAGYTGVLRELENQVLLRQREYEGIEKEIEALGTSLEGQYGEMALCASGIQEKNARRARSEKELGELAAKAAVCQTNIARNGEALREIEQELERGLEAMSGLKAEEEALVAALLAREGDVEKLSRRMKEQEEACRLLTGREEAVSKALNGAREALRAAELALSDEKLTAATAQSALSEIEVRLLALDREEEERNSARKGTEKELEDARGLIAAAGEKLSEYENMAAGYALKRASRQEKLAGIGKKLEEKQYAVREREQRASILTEMEKSLEGYSPSVKTVMKFAAAGVVPGVIGPVSKLIGVKAEYATAIETALGFAVQNIVVEDEKSAREAIRILKERDGGRATFLPLSTIKPRSIRESGLREQSGFVGIASELVSAQERYRPVSAFLLGNIIIAEDLGSASRIAKRYDHRYRVVTLDGQVINPGGSFTGGSKFKTAGFITRNNQIGALQEEIAKLKEEYEALLPAYRQAQEEAAALDRETDQLRSMRALAQQDQMDARLAAGKLEADLEAQENALKALAAQRRELLGRRESLGQHNGAAQVEQAEALVEELAQRVQKLEQELSSHRALVQEAAEALTGIKMRLLEAGKDRDREAERLNSLRARVENGGQDRQRQEERRSYLLADTLRLEREIADTAVRRKALEDEQAELEEEIKALAREREKLEGESTALRQEERVKSGLKEQVSRALASLEEKSTAAQADYDVLIAKLWEEYELTRSEAERIASPLPDTPENRGALARLRQEIRSLGTVNLSAVEEYEQVNGRYLFLKGQMEDAEKAKKELEKLIESLTRSMVTLFSQGFARIGSYFTEIFKELFGGGSASLRLTDEGDVLQSGIEIRVEPPGKIIKNLSLLSGGEQALVAIALYFAILRYRPSPFCILDEIEAALDDVNVSKFASYVKRVGKETQFIVITHRRGTMEEADVLYGVTMQEEGVSKLLEIDVAQAEREILKKKA